MSSCTTSFRQALLVKHDQQASPCSLLSGNEIYFDNYDSNKNQLNKSYQPMCTELVDTDTWIKRYGLKSNKLTYQAILSMIGFKQMQNYEDPLKKQITSRYGKGLFLKTQSSDGTVYNVRISFSTFYF